MDLAQYANVTCERTKGHTRHKQNYNIDDDDDNECDDDNNTDKNKNANNDDEDDDDNSNEDDHKKTQLSDDALHLYCHIVMFRQYDMYKIVVEKI